MEALRPEDPRQVGRYRITGRLGSGGMGEVFLGHSPGGRPVAVKLIRSDLAENAAFRARFAQEVAAARRVSGIFTVSVVDADPDADQPWLVTSYVAGPSLTEAVESRGPLPATSVLSLAAGLAEGVAAIHAAGVVHRDLKPSNVLLAPDGPRIIDFGISRALDASRLTGTGGIVGSPGFMSPEQAEGGAIGPPSDMFSLGSVITFAATGDGPFGSGPATALLYRIVHGVPAIHSVPAQIRPLVARSLSKQPALRPTAEEFLEQISALTRSGSPGEAGPPERQPTVPAVPAVPVATVAAAAAATVAVTPTPRTVMQPQDFSPDGGGPDVGPAVPGLTRRRRSRPRVIGVAVLLAVALAAGGLALSLAGNSSRPSRSHHAVASPQKVVREYIRDINLRDWRAAWRLGGDHISKSYRQFVAGFQLTKRVVITSLVPKGNSVYVRTLAYETTGPVQTYSLFYRVRSGRIVLGQQTLISTRA